MAPPPTLPADARRAEPPPNPLTRSRDADAAQLSTLLTAAQRLEQSAQASAASLAELRSELTAVRGQLSQANSTAGVQELRGELQNLRGQLAQASATSLQELRGELQGLRGQLSSLPVKDLAPPPPLFAPPPPAPSPSRVASVAAVVAAITALGALAGAALVIVEQKQQLASLAEVAATTHSISQTVTQLGETVSSLTPSAAGEHGKPGGKPTEPAQGKPAVCPPDAEGTAANKARVLLPNLVGLRLAEARATVAPLQLQLLPTDKKLKEASKIGWQLPNPGAEVEPDEAVTVSLKPPKQKKNKKG